MKFELIVVKMTFIIIIELIDIVCTLILMRKYGYNLIGAIISGFIMGLCFLLQYYYFNIMLNKN
jgi:uncharacterized membrane-anchored protein